MFVVVVALGEVQNICWAYYCTIQMQYDVTHPTVLSILTERPHAMNQNNNQPICSQMALCFRFLPFAVLLSWHQRLGFSRSNP